jgi:hypothetical protein
MAGSQQHLKRAIFNECLKICYAIGNQIFALNLSKVSCREKQIMIVKSTLMAWIRRRRGRKFNISSSLENEFLDSSIILKDPNDSTAPISAQEC